MQQLTNMHSCSKFSVMPIMVTKRQYSQPIGHFTKTPLSQWDQSIYTMCLHIYQPVLIDNLHSRQQVALHSPCCSGAATNY